MAEKINYETREAFDNYLFTKGYLVNWDGEDRQDCVRSLYALGSVFGIKIVRNPQLTVWSMVRTAQNCIGEKVPTPFYIGFPKSVAKLTEEEQIIDRMIHYAVTYGLGDFSQPGHSVLEEEFERLAFREHTEPKEFEIVEEKEAFQLLRSYVNAMLTSTRALSKEMETMVLGVARLFPVSISVCNCKDTAIRLLCETRHIRYARFLHLPDVIKLADELNYQSDLPSPAVKKAQKKYREEMHEYRSKYQVYKKYLSEHRKYEDAMKAFEAELKAYEEKVRQYIEAKEKQDASIIGRIAGLFSSEKDQLSQLHPPVAPTAPAPVAAPVMPEEPFALTRKNAKQNKTVRMLNLRNRDRKLIEAVIDSFFEQENPNVRDCYEKRQLWAGLLHHIHYVPKNEAAAEFVQAMRGKGENKSVYSAFEAAMAEGDIKKAVDALVRGKGSGAVGRNLNYLLSRCKDESDIQAVIPHLDGLNVIMLIQMIGQYKHYHTDKRTFKFVQHHLLTRHKETDEEAEARRSVLPESIRDVLVTYLHTLLSKALATRSVGKVYVEDGMEKISVPLQMAAGDSGFGVLPTGSRLRIPEGDKLRCFTYWEKVHDIDLACFGLGETGLEQTEFSWRTAWETDDDEILFSGDETSGYDGGSEYFDVNLTDFRKKYPDVRYLVFTDNVYTGIDFDDVLCTAGYMIREEKDSGEIFEPKTVKSSFRVLGKNTFSILFAVDLQEREMIWLNLSLDSDDAVAGDNEIAMVREYLDATDIINMASLFRGMATEIAEKPEDADLIVADHYTGELKEGQKLICSQDYELILEYLNGSSKTGADANTANEVMI